MPILEQRILKRKAELGVWQIEETEAWFIEQMELTEREAQQLAKIKGGKRREWLAVRYLVHYLSGRRKRGVLLKDEFGKPYLDQSHFHISISHSHGKAAVIAAPELCGIDIQKIVPKILRIQEKFMNPKEIEGLSEEHKLIQAHIIWGAKESLYKAYGRKKIDFKSHLHIQAFDYQPEGGNIQGYVLKDKNRQTYDIRYETVGDFVLVYARQQKADTKPLVS